MADSPAASLSDLAEPRVPLVIGVTGHRTLADPDAIDRAVRRELRILQARYPHTPFVCLSPLAEGADRLVAQACQDVLDADLIVPLPLPEDLYRDDFADARSEAEFDALCDAAAAVFESPLEASREAVRPYDEPRNRQYAQVGALVVEHCDILVAVWDGEPARGTGGTGDVVQWARQGRAPAAYTVSDRPDRPFYHPNETEIIHVHAHTAAVTVHPHEGVFGDYTDAEPSDVETSHRDVLASINRYNADVQEIPFTKADRQQSLRHVLGDAWTTEGCQTPSMHHLVAHYTRADVLAQRLQANYHGRLRSIYGLSAVAVFVSALAGLYPVLVAANLFVVGAAYALLKSAEHRGMEARFLRTRALAEGLRVAIFWHGAGIAEHVRDYYLNKYAVELAFCRIVQQNLEVQRWMLADPFVRDASCLSTDAIRDLWIDDQIRYFSQTKTKVRIRAHRMSAFTTFTYRTAFLMVVAMAAVAVFADPIQPWFNGLALAVSLTLAAGVSIQSYQDKLGLEALDKHYTKAERLYRTARSQLNALGAASDGDSHSTAPDDRLPEDVERTLITLGRETLLEHGDWLWSHQERSISVPTAG